MFRFEFMKWLVIGFVPLWLLTELFTIHMYANRKPRQLNVERFRGATI